MRGIGFLLVVIVAVAGCNKKQPGAAVTYTALSAAADHVCGVQLSDGRAVCWGGDHVHTAPDGVAFTSVAAYASGTCGITDAGAVQCWDDQPPAAAWGTAMTEVAAHDGAACAVDGSGTLTCQGKSVGTAPKIALSGLAAGTADICGVDDNGQITCWGAQCGDKPCSPLDGKFTDVAVGDSGICGLDATGAMQCSTATALTGTFTAIDMMEGTDEPVGLVSDGTIAGPLPLTGNYVSMTAGARYVCGLTSDGVADCAATN